jgi:1-acylglycerol-3-phosphate O-acyltransferase
MTGAPIVPVAILNSHRIFANGGLIPQLRIMYGVPISFHGDRKSKEALDAFSAEIMAHIAQMKEELARK